MAVGRLTRYGLPFSNVVPTGTATNMITGGRTLENLQLKLGGTAFTKAMISLFRMKANGKTVVEGAGTEIDKVNAYRGANTTNAAFLDILFADYSLNNELDRQIGSFDTTGISNLTTEVTIAGATAPVLTPILVETAAQKLPGTDTPAPFAGLIAKLLRYPFAIPNGGKLPVQVPFGPANGSIIKRLHFIHTGQMTGITIKQDSLVIHESVKVENEFMQTRHGRVPQANMYTVDFVIDGDIKKALDTRNSRSLELLPEFSAADNGVILVEYLDPLANL